MKHSDLIEILDSLTPENSAEVLEILSQILVSNLSLGNEINIKNIGKFYIKKRKASNAYIFTGRNEGKVVKVKPKDMICFKISNNLRSEVKKLNKQNGHN